MTEAVQLCLIQEQFLVGDIKANARKIISQSHLAKQAGADIVIFPELALSGYPPEDLLMRQGFINQIEAAINEIAINTAGLIVVFGAPRLHQHELFNAAVVCSEGKVTGEYHKYSLPNYAVFDEKRYFQSGKEPLLIEIKQQKIGIIICEDAWFDEPVQKAKDAGAQAIVILNASPYHRNKHQQRLDMLRHRQKQAALPMFYLNLVGGQDELVFDGDSLVMNAQSELVGRGPDFEPALLHYQLHEDQSVTAVNTPFHQPESDLSNIYKALVTSVRDYVKGNGFNGVVIGLSGGVDSALTLAVAVDALGSDQVHAVMMPSRYTAQMSLDDAAAQADIMSVDYKVISIEPTFQVFLETLKDEFANTEVDTTEENIQARCRGVILMALSNKLGRMVLTTGNKSEMAVGYCTLYGDMAGGFAPLKDVEKLLVYALCDYRNSVKQVIPQRVLDRPPSAELREDQEDQDSLPDYAILDAILRMSVEEDKPRQQIIDAGYEQQTVDKILRMVQINEYKRRQAPPGVRITQRAFGRDRRYPITSGYRRG
ncbi:MAG: NAD+ synthase [endosymbiont of Galathealinum brachiosum]|uniref:Glutamine-dependent NAD(+) synthetase n=1 Tax=endosymbiont of Galathealinum brachiosum TaxID=2200906 RepID=A0A370D9R0_9GAMM|nr:MAG: NAD+ synthase [endosymbiont of Galathealinum brachiosum]